MPKRKPKPKGSSTIERYGRIRKPMPPPGKVEKDRRRRIISELERKETDQEFDEKED